MKYRIWYFIFIIILMVTDQVTKALVARNILLNSSKEIIPGFFQLVHIRNKGAIFGFFSQSGNRTVWQLWVWLFIIFLRLRPMNGG
jgi:signal peptidase II